jgi:hypothetical protein
MKLFHPQKPPGLLMKILAALMFIFAALGLFNNIDTLRDQGYLLAWVGSENNVRHPFALPGVFGLMVGLAGALVLGVFGWLFLYRIKLALGCSVLAVLLMIGGTMGMIPCEGGAAVKCDLAAPAAGVPNFDLSLFQARWESFGLMQALACAVLVVWLMRVFLLLMAAYYARQSRNWPGTPATITESQVSVVETTPYQWGWSVRYWYGVNGENYDGERVFFGGMVPRRVALAIVAKFPLHAAVTAYYQPDNPARSVLMPGTNKYNWQGFLFTPLYWLAALLLWLA